MIFTVIFCIHQNIYLRPTFLSSDLSPFYFQESAKFFLVLSFWMILSFAGKPILCQVCIGLGLQYLPRDIAHVYVL